MVKVCLKAPYSGARGQGRQEDRREEQGSTKPWKSLIALLKSNFPTLISNYLYYYPITRIRNSCNDLCYPRHKNFGWCYLVNRRSTGVKMTGCRRAFHIFKSFFWKISDFWIFLDFCQKVWWVPKSSRPKSWPYTSSFNHIACQGGLMEDRQVEFSLVISCNFHSMKRGVVLTFYTFCCNKKPEAKSSKKCVWTRIL